MQTAQAPVGNADNNSVCNVQILLDSGSQCIYITETLCKNIYD